MVNRFALAAVLALFSCSKSKEPPADSGRDGSSDSGRDGSTDGNDGSMCQMVCTDCEPCPANVGISGCRPVCPGDPFPSCRSCPRPDAAMDADATNDADSSMPDVMPMSCTCDSGCGPQERCMQSQFGGLTPMGVECDDPIGLAECRPLCGDGCSGERPFCREIQLSAGCCSDAGDIAEVCCANEDATSVEDCF